MLLFRRFPGILYNHKYLFFIFVFAGCVLSLFLSWGVICTNWEPWAHVNRLCTRYKLGQVVGDLCQSLCVEKRIDSMSCHAWHAGKDAVFTVRLIADRPRTAGGGRGLDEFLVIKSAQQAEPNDIFHWIDHSGEHYPTELEFQRMIRHRVSSRLNVTLSESDSRRLSVFVSGRKAADDTEERHAEMREIWRLLQDNEYLLSMVYSDREIFPKLLGSCGQYFAVEYLHPIMDGEVAKIISKGDSDWPGRIHLAVMVLELVEEIDSQGLLLCDVKPSHFGLSFATSAVDTETGGGGTGLGRVKFLDLDVAVPKQIADSITSDGRSCNDDTDCYLFDCRSTCNKAERICDSPVATTNIQIVCEKVLLGWSMVTRVMLPGLLMTRRTTLGLASLLRQCAQPDTDPDAAAHSHQRLANTLLEMDNAMAKDRKNLLTQPVVIPLENPGEQRADAGFVITHTKREFKISEAEEPPQHNS